jgi:hypothetical protein
MYPIQQLVKAEMIERGLSRMDIVKALGYKNPGKGSRVFDNFMSGKDYSRYLLEHLPAALGITSVEIQDRLRDTFSEISEEKRIHERAVFDPFLFVRTENKRPGQITVCAMGGFDKLKRIQLDKKFMTCRARHKDKIIRSAIGHAVEKYNGVIPTFGKIMDFVLIESCMVNAKPCIVYNAKGIVAGKAHVEPEDIGFGVASLRLGGKIISLLMVQ